MPDIHTVLRNYGEHLEELAPAVTVDELEQVQTQPTQPASQWQRPTLVVAGAALVVLMVIGGLSILFSGGQTEPVATTVVDTTPPTVPTTVPEAAPEPTIPALSLPPPPALGEAVELHPDQVLLATVLIEAALTVGNTDISVDLDEPDTPGIYPSGDLFTSPTVNDASQYLANSFTEEMEPELDQPDAIGLGDESVSYRTFFGRAGPATIHLIRVGRLVYETREFQDELDLNETSAVVAAMESTWNPSITAFHGPIEEADTFAPSAPSISYLFDSWTLPVGDVEGGDKAAWSIGYDRDSQGACTSWTGEVEPLDITTYTPAGDSVDVSREFIGEDGWTTEETTVTSDNADYLAAVEGCDRFPALAEQWGLGDLVATSTPNFDAIYAVYQTGEDEFVLVAPQNGYSDSEQGDFDQLLLFDRPPDVTVTDWSNIGVDGLGYVSIWVELEGPRDSLAEMFGIDLNSMPNERIGVGFQLEG